MATSPTPPLQQVATGHARRWGKSIPAFAVTAVVLASCGGTSSAAGSSAAKPTYHLVSPGVLTVAVWGSEPPPITVGTGDQWSGINADLINDFVTDQHLKLDLYHTTFPGGITAVEQGKADVFAYFFYSLARGKAIYYTYPFFAEANAVFTLPSFQYSGPQSLKGRKIGLLSGGVFPPYIDTFVGASNVVQFADQPTMETALLNGQITAVIDAVNIDAVTPFTSTNVAFHLLNPGDFGIPAITAQGYDYDGVNCQNKALATALNAELSHLHATGAWTTILSSSGVGSTYPTVPSPPLVSPQQGC